MLGLEQHRIMRAASLADLVCRRFVLNALQKFPHGNLILCEPDGKRIVLGAGPAAAELQVLDWRLYRMLFTGGGLGAAEAYVEGLWRADDLVSVVRYFAANVVTMQQLDRGAARLFTPLRRILHYWNRNSLRGSRRNIAAHYDLGNDFFQLFLDKNMMYSSAVFAPATASLEGASLYKLDLVCRKLELRPEHNLLEIGSGWGGLAIHAASRYGCRVTTTTISREQYLHVCRRVSELGLTDRITVLESDYRELDGQFDRIVSVEMIEAVGHQYLPVYFRALERMLKPDGLLCLQAITIPDQRYRYALNNMDFIKRYIFPGGFLPAVGVLCDGFARHTSLVVRDLQDIGPDYAITLEHWRGRFLAALERVRGQGFDERFCRMWDYYLAYCEGAFRERAISTVQMVAAGPRWRPTRTGGERV